MNAPAVRYLLDTDMCFRLARNDNPHARKRFEALHRGELGLSVVTFGELFFSSARGGVLEGMEPVRRLADIVPVIPLATEVAAVYARLRNRAARTARPLGMNRLWLAAHALQLDATLVTFAHDLDRSTLGVRTENWLAH